MPVYSVIDIGTNSVKFHIGERLADGSWRTVLDRAEVTRLGEGLREGGEFTPGAIGRTVAAVAGMADEARRHEAAAIVAVGTMGMRVARNSDGFIAAVREKCGVDVEIIPGDEEGRLAYLAVVSGVGLVPGNIVVFDTGGGSTQFTIGRGTVVDQRFSLNLGAVRLTEQFRLDGPVGPDDLTRVLETISGELSRLDGVPRPQVLVGMGGAITNMTAVMLGLTRYDPDAVQGSILSRAAVDRQIELYRTHDVEQRREIVGLQPKRADVILAGACVVHTVMDKLGMDSLTVSDRGLRHGVLLERFG
jgi:exopolyphosphatase / guanosine-5'-triphosphate,3'-diphosphate pyrophosphatase